jgi:hypothetical protein
MTKSVAIITVIRMTLQFFQECVLPRDNMVEESHNVLNNCLSKDNFNVIVAQKKIML